MDRFYRAEGYQEYQYELPFERPRKSVWRFVPVAVLIVVFAMLALPSFAQEQGAGLVCNTMAQVQSFLTEKGDTATRIKAINEKAGETACGVIPVYYIRDTEVIKASDGFKRYDIVKITIIAVHNGQNWVTVPPMEQYTLFQSNETPV